VGGPAVAQSAAAALVRTLSRFACVRCLVIFEGPLFCARDLGLLARRETVGALWFPRLPLLPW
jgi:hypothetical protein